MSDGSFGEWFSATELIQDGSPNSGKRGDGGGGCCGGGGDGRGGGDGVGDGDGESVVSVVSVVLVVVEMMVESFSLRAREWRLWWWW